MARERVAVAMSGGVDSSVAAALAREAGHEVIGLTALVSPCDVGARMTDTGGSGAASPGRASRRCCAIGAERVAADAALALGIAHEVVDARDVFLSRVIDPSREAQGRGLTPNPCVLCNEHVKFGLLLDRASMMGALAMWTGHYARLGHAAHPDCIPELLRAADPARDQSYFLFTLAGDARLAYLGFPLGGMDKPAVRAAAARFGLPNADRPASQDLCFPSSPSRGAGTEPGPIVHADGTKLGTHPGLGHFTVGQRHGLGSLAGAGHRAPLFVLALRGSANELVVGPEELLFSSNLRASLVAWDGTPPTAPVRVLARIRYRHDPAPATAMVHDGLIDIAFDEPQKAITPGQALVCYDGDRVMGGGFIAP